MASVIGFRVLPFFVSNSENKYGSRVQVRSLGDADAKVLSSDSVVVNGTSIGGERGKGGTSIDQGNGHLRPKVEEKRRVKDEALETLKPLWNDGYGTETVRDFFDMAKDIVKHDGGPPRWFCPISCGRPLKDSPILLFLPGMDGTGLGLVLHHKALGKTIGFDDIIPRDTLLWKLKLLKSAAAYANSRLHAIKAEVLVLASGKDNMLPSRDEAERLKNSLQDCVVRHFKDNGHTLLLEDGIGLMTVIKGTSKFRRSRRHSYASDFLPPSMTELNYACDQIIRLLRLASGSILFSTLEDGKIVKGLAGVPNEGPVILVGYHMLMGVELSSLAEGFLREKNIMVRGLAHPTLFSRTAESSSSDFSLTDWMRVFGAVPVTPSNLFKLLSTKSHVLLYPGGSREALHYKGEEYKLFWPDQQEFVRMAARFGATIVPFGVVGEDDVAELVLDYNDLMRIPVVNDLVKDANENAIRLRDEASGEVASQKLFIPLLMPKIPGRFYYLFGKPIKTKGREDILKDKQAANQLYLQVKSEVERQISFLIKKRQEDPYRSIVDRTLYKAIYAPSHEVPAFEP
nr:acyltransferase-like protein At1g54570, chloroplastic [Quercus suber]